MASPEKVTYIDEYKQRQERQQLLARAAYWDVRRDELLVALAVAERERATALQLAGMISGEGLAQYAEEESGERMVREEDRERANVIQLELDYGTADGDNGVRGLPSAPATS